MVINLTEYNLSKLTENTGYDSMICQWNTYFNSLAVFIILLVIIVIIAGTLKIRFENSISLCFFIATGLTSLIGLLLYFVNVADCGRLIAFKHLSIILVLFLASSLILFFDKENQ